MAKLRNNWGTKIIEKQLHLTRKGDSKNKAAPAEMPGEDNNQPAGHVALASFPRKEWGELGDVSHVLVSKVIVPEGTPDPDPVLVANIAESIQVFGLIHPIAARFRGTAFGTSEIILVDGTARLAAYKLLGEATVPCVYFPDDETATRFIQLCESLFRKLCRTR